MSLALAIRAAILLGAGAVASRALRSLPPASRHALWLAVVFSTLALPVIALVSPSWSVRPRLSRPEQAATRLAAPEGTRWVGSGIGFAGPVWLGGGSIVTLYFLSGYARLWRLRRRARPAPPAWAAAVARLCARSGLARPVDILVSPDVRGPLVTGLWSATVLIPPGACAWSAARREAALIHELAHVERGDLAAQLAAQLLVIVHWFDPLAWYALREMRRDRELACDEAVLGAGVAPLDYATELLAIATAGPGGHLPASALSMARASELEGRLSAVLNPRLREPRRSQAPGAVLALLVVPISATISGAHLVAPPPQVAASPPGVMASWPMLPGGDVQSNASEAAWTAGSNAARERATVMLAMTPGRAVIPPLLRALGDPDARVREKAALGLAWRRDDRVGPALLSAAADPSPGVREKVLVALAFSGEPRAAAVIDAARSDPDPGVRKKARAMAGRGN